MMTNYHQETKIAVDQIKEAITTDSTENLINLDLPSAPEAMGLSNEDTIKFNGFSEIDDSSSTSTLTTIDPRGLRFAPPEVRQMIFENFFEEYTHTYIHTAKILALFKALRDDKTLYDEALAMYTKTTIFCTHWDTKKKEIWVPMNAIKKLDLNFYYLIYRYDAPSSNTKIPSKILDELLSKNSNITELNLCFPIYDRTHIPIYETILKYIDLCLLKLSRLQKFSIEIDKRLMLKFTLGEDSNEQDEDDVVFNGIPGFRPKTLKYSHKVVDAVDRCLASKRESKLDRNAEPNHQGENLKRYFRYVWSAEPGKVLTWDTDR